MNVANRRIVRTEGKWIVEKRINYYVIIDLEQPHASPVAGEMNKTTADYIVKMRNSSAELVKALKAVLINLAYTHPKDIDWNVLAEKLKSAIARAENN